MKQLIKILSLNMILFVGLATSVSAQTLSTRFVNRNYDERIAQRIVTTDSTLTYIDSVKLGTNECGFVTVRVVGLAKDTAYGITGTVTARFNKRRGTLTLGSVIEATDNPITRDAVLAHTAVGGATFTLVAVNNNIYVRVKGVTPLNITWQSITQYKTLVTYSN